MNIRLACITVNQTPLDWKGNLSRMEQALEEHNLSDIILYPELCITGYGCEDAFHSPDVTERAWKKLESFVKKCAKLAPRSLVACGLPVRYHHKIYNCIAVIASGSLIAIIPKENLPGDGVHYEPRWFNTFREDAVRYQDIPFGSSVINFKNIKIGIEICEDAWVNARPALGFISQSVDIILNPSASHFAFGKQNIRRNIVLESSRAYSCIYASVNLLGNESGRLIYDGGCIVAAGGKLLCESKRFSFKDYQISCVDFNPAPLRVLRSRTFSYNNQSVFFPRAPEIIAEFKEEKNSPIGFDQETSKTNGQIKNHKNPKEINIENNLTKEEEFLYAVTLGLFDYMRKSKAKGFVISLSGGADSALCALLVERMIRYAKLELGEEAYRKLGIKNTDTLLYTVYQKSKHSTSVTANAASAIAHSLKEHTAGKHFETDISDIIELYTNKTQTLLAADFQSENYDLTLQNIQARSRSPLAWMIANATRTLLLTTSNRSEAAVGYCTMDGDTSGGLAPVAGIDKNYIRYFLKYMECTGDFFGKIAALRFINEQEPTAELKSNQTDERDLMPYFLLDEIEKLAIRDRMSPLEIFNILKEKHEGPELKKHITRFFRLWYTNQWKRERYAPSFHLDDENLDPKTWFRFPILSGGYEEELEELQSK